MSSRNDNYCVPMAVGSHLIKVRQIIAGRFEFEIF
jgi:hypothetical protein